MTPAIDITAEQQETILSLLERYLPGTTAWAYGSRVRRTSRPTSDLDLVVFATPEQDRRVGDLREAFEEGDLPFPVDLFVWDEVPKNFRERIEAERVVLVEKQERDVGGDWPMAPLGQVTELTLSSVDKKTKPREHAVLLCNYMDVYSNRFIRSDLDFMTATANEREIQRCTLRPEDVVITKDSEQYDDIGVPALVRDDIDSLVCGYHLAILRPLRESIRGSYLLYALQIGNVQHQFHAYANGVTRFGLRKDDILRVEIPLPPLPEQRAIARVLGALDDKIELNRRMNETLEAMARALFKSWFVDFAPVRAKAEGRDPGLPDHIADLFPDRLVDSEIGEIPEGWRVGRLGDIANTESRTVNPEDVHEDTPYIGLEHMPRRSIALTEWEGAGKVKSNKSHFKAGDILFGKLRPYFHKVGIAPLDGICSTDIVVVRPKSYEWCAMVLFCVSTDQFVDFTSQISTGTKMPRTNWKAMVQYELALPPLSLASEHGRIMQPTIDRIVANIHGARILTTLRETLLPKLMSGEVRLGEAIGRLRSAA